MFGNEQAARVVRRDQFTLALQYWVLVNVGLVSGFARIAVVWGTLGRVKRLGAV